MMMVQYLLDTDRDVTIPGVEAPQHGVRRHRRAGGDGARAGAAGVRRRSPRWPAARDEGDFQGEQFLQWFLKEQVEEVSSMSTLLRVVERAGGNALLGRGLPGPRERRRGERPHGPAGRRGLAVAPWPRPRSSGTRTPPAPGSSSAGRPTARLRALVADYAGFAERADGLVRRRELPTARIPVILHLDDPYGVEGADGVARNHRAGFAAGMHERPADHGDAARPQPLPAARPHRRRRRTACSGCRCRAREPGRGPRRAARARRRGSCRSGCATRRRGRPASRRSTISCCGAWPTRRRAASVDWAWHALRRSGGRLRDRSAGRRARLEPPPPDRPLPPGDRPAAEDGRPHRALRARAAARPPRPSRRGPRSRTPAATPTRRT